MRRRLPLQLPTSPLQAEGGHRDLRRLWASRVQPRAGAPTPLLWRGCSWGPRTHAAALRWALLPPGAWPSHCGPDVPAVPGLLCSPPVPLACDPIHAAVPQPCPDPREPPALHLSHEPRGGFLSHLWSGSYHHREALRQEAQALRRCPGVFRGLTTTLEKSPHLE